MQRFLYTLISVYFLSFVQAQTFEAGLNKYAFNNTINTIVKDSSGNTYVGGGFTSVGPWTGGGVLLNPTTGAFNPSFVRVVGTVNAVVAIPAAQGGGWYIGGDFTEINGETRNRLARINADGTLHSFNPNMNSAVSALAIDGSGNVYVGGTFTSVGGTSRNYLCKFNASGSLTAFNPNMDNVVYALSLNGSGSLYAGGGFTSVGGTSRNSLCQFDASGSLTAFNPNMDFVVSALAVDANNNL